MRRTVSGFDVSKVLGKWQNNLHRNDSPPLLRIKVAYILKVPNDSYSWSTYLLFVYHSFLILVKVSWYKDVVISERLRSINSNASFIPKNLTLTRSQLKIFGVGAKQQEVKNWKQNERAITIFFLNGLFRSKDSEARLASPQPQTVCCSYTISKASDR
jgi:hypothetical protein